MDREAEILEVATRLKEYKQSVPFKMLAAEMFESFQATEKHLIMMNIFN